MFGLSINTLIFIIFIGYFQSVVIYLLYIFLYHSREFNLRLYVTGKIIQSTTWLLYLLWSDGLTGNLMAIANSFLYIGASIEVYCMVQANRESNKKLIKQLSIITSLSILFGIFFRNNIIARVLVTSTSIAAIYSYLFVLLVTRKDNLKMQSVIGWIALLFVIINFTRGIFTLSTGFEIPLYTDIPIQIITGLFWLVVAYTFPLLFLFILKESDNLKLQELNITKDKFFRIIGHDLKGPIAQLIQFSQLIEDNYKELGDEKILIFIKAMRESSTRGFKLLENLLDWSRSQTGSITFKPEPFSIDELIIENIQILHKQADIKNIQIINTSTSNETITADKNMINTVVRNLLSNAIKFTQPDGKIEINNQLDKNKLIVSVKDNGVGMSCENCNNLFKIDSEQSTLGTNNEKGTGIGLILCKEFIEKHNGKIWIESKLGKGSTFSFSIPNG